MFGRPTVSVSFLSADSARATDAVRSPFRSIHDAISSFLDLIDPAIKLMTANVTSKYAGVKLETVAEQIRLGGLMDDWQLNFDYLMQNERTVPLNGYNVMLGITMSVRVWLEASLSTDEMIWDKYNDKFEEMVQLAEPVIYDSLRFPDESSKAFSFELGIIPTLQFVAWKCRWPKIRRKALQLLRIAPKRECVFDSSYVYALYEKVRELEESALNLSPGEVPADDQLPPEHARVHIIDLPPLAPTWNGKAVRFLTRPGGSGQGWSVRSEILHLNEVNKPHQVEDDNAHQVEDDNPHQFAERQTSVSAETSTTGLRSPDISEAPSFSPAGDGTSTGSYSPSVAVKFAHEDSLVNDVFCQIGETPQHPLLGTGEMDTPMAIEGNNSILTPASMNDYSGMIKLLASERATFAG